MSEQRAVATAGAPWRATCRRGGWLLAAALCLAALEAHAQNATWSAAPPTSDWNTAANWTPPTVPTGVASFGGSTTTSVTLVGGSANINTIQFNAGAPAYTFTVTGANFTINNGIINNSSFTPTFTSNGDIIFASSATASGTVINNIDFLDFFNTSTGGNATINNLNNFINFHDTSTAGNATINNNALVNFNDSSSAGNAVISGPGLVQFFQNSTAANATITSSLNGVNFFNTSTAANATIAVSGGAVISFNDTASGGSARFIALTGGSFDISKLLSAGTTAGSIEGAGTYFLGSKTLTVGSNNLSTTVSGVISDGGAGGGIGGSLTKIGAGTLTLTAANTYTGATAVNGGTLVVNGSIAASSLTTINAGGTLSGTGTVGNLTVANGGIFAPGPPGGTGAMIVAGNLAVQPGGIYFVQSNGAGNSIANVTGTATLTGGSVRATVASLRPASIDILHAGGGLGGTNFGSVSVPLFYSSLTYTPTDVFLNLVPTSNAKVGWIAATQQQLSFSQVDTVLEQVRDKLQKKRRPDSNPTPQPTAYAPSDRDTNTGSPSFAAATLPGGAYAAYDAAPTAAPAGPAWGGWVQGQEDWQRNTPLSATDTGRVTRTHSGQVGVDLTWKGLMAADDAFVLGSVASTMTSDIADIGSPSTSTLRGPGIGTYLMYVRGGFSTDLTAKLDVLGMHQYAAGLAPDTSFGILNAGLSGNMQYKLSGDDDKFIEPTVGFSFTRTMFDRSAISAFGLQNSDTVRVQAGARVGTSWKVDDITIDANLKSLVYSDVIAEPSSLIPAGFVGITPNDQGLIRGELDPDLCFNLADGYSVTLSGQVRFGQAVVGGAGGINFRKQW